MRDRYLPKRSGQRSNEKDHLEDLVSDFGVSQDIDLDGALQHVFDMWRSVNKDLSEIGDSISTKVESGDASLRGLLRARVKMTHELLFSEILVNAGEYRKATDPNRGSVFFGGRKKQTTQPRYRGANPSDIEEGLSNAFSHLEYQPDAGKKEITRSAALFYAAFVRVHPFYDANGRIGRFLVTLYLYVHGYYIDWSTVSTKRSEFHRRLNKHHDTCEDLSPEVRERYISILESFFLKRIVSVETLTQSDESDG